MKLFTSEVTLCLSGIMRKVELITTRYGSFTKQLFYQLPSELVTHMIRTLCSTLCRAERPGFEPRYDHPILSVRFTSYCINLLYLFYQLVVHTDHGDGQNKVTQTCHLFYKNYLYLEYLRCFYLRLY